MKPAGWGFAPGTFGELVHGVLDRQMFLVTLPIRWGTRAQFVGGAGPAVTVYPKYRRKAQMAAHQLCSRLGVPGGTLTITSLLPVGKGMASSSADIVSAFRAVLAAYGRKIPVAELARMASAIEPSDGIMYPGMNAFDPIRGQLLERMGSAPPAVIVGLLGAGRVNTSAQYRNQVPYLPEQQKQLETALAKARQGVCLHRMEELGEAGRLSAEIHLERNPGDRTLAVILEQARQSGWGVVVAHTGTVRGFIFSPEKLRTREPAAAERFLKSLDRGPVLRIWTLSRPVSCSGRIAVDRVPPPFPQRADGVVT